MSRNTTPSTATLLPARRGRRLAAGAATLALTGAYALAAPGLADADDDGPCTTDDDVVTCTWDEQGHTDDYTLPDDATDITITAIGGAGGHGGYSPTLGGDGARNAHTWDSTSDLPVGPDLDITIGSPGDDGGTGLWETGNGGTATTITSPGGDTHEPDDVLMFAAGGGGGAGDGGYSEPDIDGGDGASFIDLDNDSATPTTDALHQIGIGGTGGDDGPGGDGDGDGGEGGDGDEDVDSPGGDGGDGYGGPGGDGMDDGPGGPGGDGYGAQGGYGGDDDGGTGGTGGLSYIAGESTLDDDGHYPIVGEPTGDAPSVTIEYTLIEDNGDGDDDWGLSDSLGSASIASLFAYFDTESTGQ